MRFILSAFSSSNLSNASLVRKIFISSFYFTINETSFRLPHQIFLIIFLWIDSHSGFFLQSLVFHTFSNWEIYFFTFSSHVRLQVGNKNVSWKVLFSSDNPIFLLHNVRCLWSINGKRALRMIGWHKQSLNALYRQRRNNRFELRGRTFGFWFYDLCANGKFTVKAPKSFYYHQTRQVITHMLQ